MNTREHGGTPHRGIRVGKCYACGRAVLATEVERRTDPTTGTRRLLHRGKCADRFDVMSPGWNR